MNEKLERLTEKVIATQKIMDGCREKLARVEDLHQENETALTALEERMKGVVLPDHDQIGEVFQPVLPSVYEADTTLNEKIDRFLRLADPGQLEDLEIFIDDSLEKQSP